MYLCSNLYATVRNSGRHRRRRRRKKADTDRETQTQHRRKHNTDAGTKHNIHRATNDRESQTQHIHGHRQRQRDRETMGQSNRATEALQIGRCSTVHRADSSSEQRSTPIHQTQAKGSKTLTVYGQLLCLSEREPAGGSEWKGGRD